MDVFEKYNEYNNLDISNLKHIPEISYYNCNYFIGLKRDSVVNNDLILEQYNESTDTYEYFLLNKTDFEFIGYRFPLDDAITLSNERLI